MTLEHPDYYEVPGVFINYPDKDWDSAILTAMDISDALVMNFNLGCVLKYIIRQGRKDGCPAIDDLRKARRCLDREIERLDVGTDAAYPDWDTLARAQVEIPTDEVSTIAALRASVLEDGTVAAAHRKMIEDARGMSESENVKTVPACDETWGEIVTLDPTMASGIPAAGDIRVVEWSGSEWVVNSRLQEGLRVGMNDAMYPADADNAVADALKESTDDRP